MATFAFDVPATPSVAIGGSERRFPVRRIFCVGRNYEEHRKEMGGTDRDPPVFFTKPADALVADGEPVPYPPRTRNFHHEIELVVAIGRGGRDVPPERALDHVFGYAVGNDWTRRDLQSAAKEKGAPWDMGKGFDRSASIGAIREARHGHPRSGRIWLAVNGAVRQQADLAEMIWAVPEIVAELSTYVELAAGDLIYTGTPAGVGAVQPGDRVEGGIDGVGTLANPVVAPGAGPIG